MQKSIKIKDISNLLILVGIIIGVNIVGKFIFKRFDLTSEKRYTLSESTKKLLNSLDDELIVKVYLAGQFPAGFQRLQKETKEILNEFKIIGKKNFQYSFINPSESNDPKERNEVYKNLNRKGLQPTNLQSTDNGSQSQQIIFPGALITYKGREFPVQLLKSMVGAPPEVMLNSSINDLEYEITNAIRKIIEVKPKTVAFLRGHGESNDDKITSITKSLREYYTIIPLTINEELKALNGINGLIISNPDSLFSEKDKFIIDQFIMNGGKVLWLVDGTIATMDSLVKNNNYVAFPNQTNLQDQLFRYGVRINTNLVQDIQSGVIPIISGYVGNQPQTQLYPWLYFPLIFQTVKHPVVNNLNAVKFEFASSIDTVTSPGVSKQLLLTSSKFSRSLNAPVRVGLAQATIQLKESQFNKPYSPLAVLLEGTFTSNFKNRINPEIQNNTEIKFKLQSEKNSMIVVADGSILENYVSIDKKVYPLGYDRFTRETYGNREFILNCMNYLLDDKGLINIRSREVKLRLLDKTKLKTEKLKWQLLNIGFPIISILLLGTVLFFIRKRKYNTTSTKK